LIKLRLQRHGRKKRPYYHIVAADARSPRDGRIIERLGRYDNVSEKKETVIQEDRVIYWLQTGAQPTTAVRNILKNHGLLYKMHLLRWGKSEEEIEAALQEWREAKEANSKSRLISRKEKMKDVLATEEKEYKNQVDKKSKEAAAKMKAEKEAAEAAEAAPSETASAESTEPTEATESTETPAAEAAPTEDSAPAEAPSEESAAVDAPVEEPAAEVEEVAAEPEVAPAEETPAEEAAAEPEVTSEEAPATEEVAAEEASTEATETEDSSAEEEK